MAYPRSATRSTGTASARPASPAQGSVWEDLRREARKVESELEGRLAAYAKLCTAYADGAYRGRGEAGLATDQLAAAKGSEIEELLGRLSDVNDEMGSALSGAGDSRAHTLARHREIMVELTQEFRRLSTALGAARDRADLLPAAGSSETSALLGMQSSAALLRERGALQGANSVMDDVTGQAQSVAGGLGEQRRLFDRIGSRLEDVGARFPLVNSLLGAIRRKRSKDTLVISAVVAACTLFIFFYWLYK